MTHVLHLDSSARGGESVSRLLGEQLLDDWAVRDPDLVVTYRDLDAEPLPFVNDSWVTAAFSKQELNRNRRFALSRSEQLIAELEAADVLVIGAPMYNFGIPASLKAWVDQVVRVGRTFSYQGPVPVGMVHGKRAVVLATSGGDANYYAELGLDFRTRYLLAILGFIGIVDVAVVDVVGTHGPVDLAPARAKLAAVLDELTGERVPAQR